MARRVRQMLREHVRYSDAVWAVAAHVIAVLGPFRYSAMHIRRNELQYTSSFADCNTTVANTAPLLRPGEVLYLATDETAPGFFDPLRARHDVYQWADFFGPRGKFALRGVAVPPKLVGPIEQVVCAMGSV
jgi:hypothetical protein